MYKKGIESWKITVSSDLSLNFAIFTGCIYGLIDDSGFNSENKLWPPKVWSAELSEPSIIILKEQWNQWFNNIIKGRGEKVISKQRFDLKNDMFNPPDFSNFSFFELKECCKKTWKPFMEWWYMVGGGNNALSHFETFGNEKLYEYINEYENIVLRQVKPFNLYIDMIYTGVNEIIEVNSEYIIIVPVKPLNFNKEWWMKKLVQIG